MAGHGVVVTTFTRGCPSQGCGSTGHLLTESRVITTLDDVPQSKVTDSWSTAAAGVGAAATAAAAPVAMAAAARKRERGDSPDPDRLRGDSTDLDIVFLRL